MWSQIVDIVSENNTTQTSRKHRSEMRCNTEDDLAPAFQARRESNTEEIIEPIPGPSFDEPVTCNNCPIIYTEESTEQIIKPIPGPSVDEPVTCYRPHEPVAFTTYQIGDIVNTKVSGEPYVAGIIKSIAGDHFYILFPYSKYGISELLFQRNEIIPYKSQFPERKFQPIYLTQNMSREAQRRMIKRHEDRASHYQQHKYNVN